MDESPNLKAKFLHSIRTMHSTDKINSSCISGAVLLSRGRLALVDHGNSCVKILDLEAKKLAGKVTLPLRPVDITDIGEDRLAVTFQKHRHLQVLRVTPLLARSITLPLPGREYGGVTFRGDKFYLACRDPRSIQICDTNGTLLQEINCLNNELEFPFSIAVSPDKTHIYVSVKEWADKSKLGWKGHKVLCLTPTGDVDWIYRHDRPLTGMDVDDQGRLHACNLHGDPSIIMLSSASRRGTLLLDKEVLLPLTVAVDGGRMYLGSWFTIYVFDLETADSALQDRTQQTLQHTFVHEEE